MYCHFAACVVENSIKLLRNKHKLLFTTKPWMIRKQIWLLLLMFFDDSFHTWMELQVSYVLNSKNLACSVIVPPSREAVISALGSGPSLLRPGEVASGRGTSSSELSPGSRIFLSLVLLFPPVPISAYVPLSLPFWFHFTGDSSFPFAWFSLLSSSVVKVLVQRDIYFQKHLLIITAMSSRTDVFIEQNKTDLHRWTTRPSSNDWSA